MDVSANQPARTAGPGSSPVLRGFGARRGGGVLPASPRRCRIICRATGVGWLIAALVLVVLSVLVLAWCSASIWSAPDESGLLRLDASSIQTDSDGSRRTVWMINRMIRKASERLCSRAAQSVSTSG